MTRRPDDLLSDEGQRRKAALRTRLLSAIASRRRSRQRRRAAMIAGVFLIGSALCSLIAISSQPTAPDAASPEEASSSSTFTIARVVTQAGIAEKYAVAPQSSAELIDDSALLSMMERSDQPTVLVMSEGHLTVLNTVSLRQTASD